MVGVVDVQTNLFYRWCVIKRSCTHQRVYILSRCHVHLSEDRSSKILFRPPAPNTIMKSIRLLDPEILYYLC